MMTEYNRMMLMLVCTIENHQPNHLSSVVYQSPLAPRNGHLRFSWRMQSDDLWHRKALKCVQVRFHVLISDTTVLLSPVM